MLQLPRPPPPRRQPPFRPCRNCPTVCRRSCNFRRQKSATASSSVTSRNSGNNYGLNAAQIIYLKQQGISSDVINAMINQRSQSAQPASTAAATSQSYNADANTPQTTTPSQPAVTYVQSVPTSSVYVVPDTQTYYYNNWLYYHNPYYGYYPGYYYPYPAVSVSFGWGGGWHGGGHDGGVHGGGPAVAAGITKSDLFDCSGGL